MPQQTAPPIGADVSDLMSGGSRAPAPAIGSDVSSLMTSTPPLRPETPLPDDLKLRLGQARTPAERAAILQETPVGQSLQAVKEFGAGALKGLGSTVYHVTHLLGDPLDRLRYSMTGEAAPPPREQPWSITPTTPTQRLGFQVEQIGEFLVPLGLEAKAATAVAKAPLAVRAAGKMAAAGTEAALKTAAQGGDAEDVVAGGLLGSLTPGLTKVFRGAGKVVSDTIPEHLYARIFPVAERDWRQAIAQQAKGALPDPTLAHEVLDRGLFGSVRNMALYATKKLNALEQELQPLAAKVTFPLPQKADYLQLLGDVQRQFGRSAFSKYAAQASALRNRLQQTAGNAVSGTDALAVKRFLDGLRTSAAFRANQVLSARQDELRGAADLIRATLRQHPGIEHLLDEEQVFTQAFEALADRAVKGGKKGLVDFMDVLAGSIGGFGAGPGGIVTGLAAKRAVQSPFTLTAIGQALYRAGQAAPQGAAAALSRVVPGLASPSVRGSYEPEIIPPR